MPFMVSVICLLLATFPILSQAQSPSGSGANATQRLTETELKGKNLFSQRCSVCHMPRGTAPRVVIQVGPSLYGLLKDAKPNTEAAVREIILKGGPNMPGFQYGLKAEQVDEIIAYLKTLKEKPSVPEYGFRTEPDQSLFASLHVKTFLVRGGSLICIE